MKNFDKNTNLKALTGIMIDTIRNNNAAFRNYKFKREQTQLKQAVAAGTNSISELNCAGLNCLKNAGITKLSQIICMCDKDIVNIQGIGSKKAEDIIQALNKVREPLCRSILAGDVASLKNVKCVKTGTASVYNIIKLLTDSRQKEIIEARFAGMKFDDIAIVFDLTKERVRQIQERGLEKARNISMAKYGSKEFAEDKYKDFFAEYKTDREFWKLVSSEGEKIYGYLDTVYGYGSGKNNLENALFDSKVSPELKSAIKSYNKDKTIVVDGIEIPKNRNGIEDYLLNTFCKNPTTIKGFMAKYNEFIIKNGLDTVLDLVTKGEERNYSTRLARKENILWLGSNSFRVYDFSNKDLKKLPEKLNLHGYIDTELSAAYFYKNNYALMQEYDIHDEYELHYILKAVIDKKVYNNISFGRTPMISFGKSDRDYTVFSTMVKMAPVTKAELVAALSKETGVNEASITANWLNGISKYYNCGKYYFDFKKYDFLYKKSA